MLKVGIIGLGMISHENVLGYLDSDDAEIIAVCDVDEEVGRRWLDKWNQPQARLYDDHGAMLETESLASQATCPPNPLSGSMKP